MEKGIAALFFLIVFFAALGWSVGAVAEWLNQTYTFTAHFDGNKFEFSNQTMLVENKTYILTREELLNYSLNDTFSIKKSNLATSSLLPFIVKDSKGNTTMRELLLKGLGMHAKQIAPDQYQVLENLTGIMNIQYNNSSCVSYYANPAIFDAEMLYKQLNLTYCDFKPDTYDVPYTPSGEFVVSTNSRKVDTRVVTGYVGYSIKNIHRLSFDICYELGYKVDGHRYIEVKRCSYGLGGGTHRFSGGYYKGWGPLAELEVVAKIEYVPGYSYLTIKDVKPKTRTIVFEKNTHEIWVNGTLYNGTNIIYVDVKPTVEKRGDFVENLVATNVSFTHGGAEDVADHFTETLWGYEEATVNYSVFVRDKIDVYGTVVERVYPAGYFVINYTSSRVLPRWGDTAVVSSVAEIVETNLTPVPPWVFKPQEIGENYAKEYLNYQVSRWTADKVSEFLNELYGSSFEFKVYEAWYIMGQVASLIVRDDNQTGYPYEALLKGTGNSIQRGEIMPAVMSFLTYTGCKYTDVYWHLPGLNGSEYQRGVLSMFLLDSEDLEQSKYPPVLFPVATLVGNMKLLLSEMGVQNSYVAVPYYATLDGDIPSIVEFPEKDEEILLRLGYYSNSSEVFDYKSEEKVVIFDRYYYNGTDMEKLSQIVLQEY